MYICMYVCMNKICYEICQNEKEDSLKNQNDMFG